MIMALLGMQNIKNNTLPDFIINGKSFILQDLGSSYLINVDLSISFTAEYINPTLGFLEAHPEKETDLEHGIVILDLDGYKKEWEAYEVL